MQQKKIFPISVIGFGDSDRKLLRSMFLLTTERDRGYKIVERADDPPGDIVLVNGDDSAAVLYNQSNSNPKHPPSAPRLFIGHAAIDKTNCKTISRPITTTRLLEALDAITATALNYHTERESTLPLRDPNPDPGITKPANAHYRALVIDDSTSVRELMKMSLLLLNINTDFVETATEAFAMLQKHRYDLVLLDITLPGIDGYRICKFIKNNSSTRTTQVCVLSNKHSTLDKIRSNLAGCDLFLVKPIQSRSFTNTIRNLLYMNGNATAASQHM